MFTIMELMHRFWSCSEGEDGSLALQFMGIYGYEENFPKSGLNENIQMSVFVK